MRKPDESLDDFSVKPITGPASQPPREVSLQSTGEVETLRPLAEPVKHRTNVFTYRPRLRKQPIWFRRFIAVGGGAIVLVAFALVSAIIVGISDPVAEPEVAMNVSSEPELIQIDMPPVVDGFSLSDFASTAAESGYAARSNGARRSGRRSSRVANYKRRPASRPSSQSAEPKFFPTTLVIYAENGVIKSRIEPWL